MKRFLILMSIMLSLSIISAISVPESKVVSVAGKWMDLQTSNRVDTSSLESVHKVYNNNTLTLYLINYQNNGFVIATSDDRCQPVLAWSDEGNISPDSDNPGLQYWLNTYSNEALSVIENDLSATETRQMWQDIDNHSYNRTDREVSPLLPCRWNQDWPYNALCPEDSAGPGGRVYAGCVATAMAQCMRYWNYPAGGTGNHGYYAYGYGYQSVNFDDSEYDWWQMPFQAGSEYDQIAKLIYDCGVSVDMMYAADGSGAYSYDVPAAMRNYFGYANTTTYVSRSDYSVAAWNNLLRNELDNDRVIYYSGSGDDGGGGHAFVLDGYQDDDYFHFDFGWSGSGNGYYLVTNLNPQGNFNAGQAAVIGIVPQGYQPNEGVLIWDGMNSADCSGSEFYVAVSSEGIEANNTDEFPYSFQGYDAVFLNFGNSQAEYSELTDPMAAVIRNYLEDGGNVYIEGADVLGVDQSSNSALMTLLGIDGVNDGAYNDINDLQGHPFSVGMNLSFDQTYQTNLETIDHYEVGDGQPVFTEDGYGVVAVQNVGIYGQKSVVMSYSMSRFGDNANKAQFIQNILDFFADDTTIYPAMSLESAVDENEQITLSWTHPGLANSSLLGYNVFDNGVLVDTIYDRYLTTYSNANPTPGLHHYTVTAGYLAGESDHTQNAEAFVFGNDYENFGYVDNSAESGIVYNAGGMAAVHFENSEEANIDFIRFNIETADTNPVILRVFDEVDGEPGNMLSQQVFRNNITDGWHTADLSGEDLVVDGNYYIAVVFTVNSSAIGVDTSQNGNTIVKVSNSSAWENYADGNLMITSVLSTTTDNNDQNQVIEKQLTLNNYPNPFNPTTNVQFSMPASGHATLSVYDIRGRKVNTLINKTMNKGEHTIMWDGTDKNGSTVGSGVYFFKLDANGDSKVKKSLLMK